MFHVAIDYLANAYWLYRRSTTIAAGRRRQYGKLKGNSTAVVTEW